MDIAYCCRMINNVKEIIRRAKSDAFGEVWGLPTMSLQRIQENEGMKTL
jgi:hypothetical protein